MMINNDNNDLHHSYDNHDPQLPLSLAIKILIMIMIIVDFDHSYDNHEPRPLSLVILIVIMMMVLLRTMIMNIPLIIIMSFWFCGQPQNSPSWLWWSLRFSFLVQAVFFFFLLLIDKDHDHLHPHTHQYCFRQHPHHHKQQVNIWQTNCKSPTYVRTFSQFQSIWGGDWGWFEAASKQTEKTLGGGKDCKLWKFFSGIQLNLNGHDRVYHLHTERMLITPAFEGRSWGILRHSREHILS